MRVWHQIHTYMNIPWYKPRREKSSSQSDCKGGQMRRHFWIIHMSAYASLKVANNLRDSMLIQRSYMHACVHAHMFIHACIRVCVRVWGWFMSSISTFWYFFNMHKRLFFWVQKDCPDLNWTQKPCQKTSQRLPTVHDEIDITTRLLTWQVRKRIP